MLGMVNPRENMGYITAGLFCHALLDELLSGNSDKIQKIAINSILAHLNPELITIDNYRDLVFQKYQEHELLVRILEQTKTLERELLLMFVNKDVNALIHFFRIMAKQAVIDAEYSHSNVPYGVRNLVNVKKRVK